MKKWILATVVATLLGWSKDDRIANDTDMYFAKRAYMIDAAQISAGRLAATKSSALNVKDFSQMMVNEHCLAKTGIKSIAVGLHLYVPDSLDAEDIDLNAQLSALSGHSFDSVYIHGQWQQQFIKDLRKPQNI